MVEDCAVVVTRDAHILQFSCTAQHRLSSAEIGTFPFATKTAEGQQSN